MDAPNAPLEWNYTRGKTPFYECVLNLIVFPCAGGKWKSTHAQGIFNTAEEAIKATEAQYLDFLKQYGNL